MALVAVQRSPSNSNSSSTISVSDNDEDEPDLILKRVCECFFAIKGAALILPHSTDPRPIKKHPVVGELQQHLQSIFFLLRTQDTITLAVRLESMYDSHIRYMVLVSTLGVNDTEETIILGVDIRNAQCTVGLMLPIWRDTEISMDGDGGFGVHTSSRAYIFKPVSIQAMWSAIQCLNKTCQIARNRNYIPAGLNLTWAGFYTSLKLSTPKCVYEWNLLPDTYSHIQEHMTYNEGFRQDGHYCPSQRELTERYIWVKLKEIMMHVDLDSVTGKQLRMRLEEEMGRDLREYKSAIDKQAMTILGQMDSASKIFDFLYLGSEWNASNYDEMNKLGIRYVLNVSLEIDNFFPLHFTYHNVRVHDDLQADLLRHWDETYRYISKAKETGTKALVHCKMGISRSAATVTAFVMKEMGWSRDRAFSYVKERRNIANPNPSFMEQLLEYEGILDASKQRHNALWRSKSESSLSTCGSLENICQPTMEATTPFSSSDDLRRRSWSPEDSMADALFSFPEHTETSYVGEIYLRNPSPMGHLADQEDTSSEDDDCSEIQIAVPSMPKSPGPGETSQTTPVQSPGGAPPSPLYSREERIEDIEGTSGGFDRGGGAGFFEDVAGPEKIQGGESTKAEEDIPAQSIEESENPLNTNNNSATCLERLRQEGRTECAEEEASNDGGGEAEEAIPVDVKERIRTIQNQISRLDSSGSPEKTKSDSPMLEDLPTNTVKRTKERLEKRLQGGLPDTPDSEEEAGGVFSSSPEVELEEAEMEVVCEVGELGEVKLMGENHETTTREAMDTSDIAEEDSAKYHQMDTSPILQDTSPVQQDSSSIRQDSDDPESCQQQSNLGNVPPQYSSPSLSKLEPGAVQRSKEKFQSWQIRGWKSPEHGKDSMAKFESVKIDSRAADVSGSSVGEEFLDSNKLEQGLQQGSSTDLSDRGATSVTCENVGCTVSPGQSDTSGLGSHIPTIVNTEDSNILVGDSVTPETEPEAFIMIPTGEEIPLQPGTVKRQKEGFEQLSCSDRPKESANMAESRTVLEDRGVMIDGDCDKSQKCSQNEDDDPTNTELDSLGRDGDKGQLGAESSRGGYGVEVSGDTAEELVHREPTIDDSSHTESEVTLSKPDSGETDMSLEASEIVVSGSQDDVASFPAMQKGDSGEGGPLDLCTVSPQGASEETGWRPGDVKKHTQELEKLASTLSVSVQKSSVIWSKSPDEDQGPTLSPEKLQEIRDLGKAILGQDCESDEDDKGNKESGGTRPRSCHDSERTSQDDSDGQEFIKVLERVRHIEVKRCASIASMSSEKVSRKYRKGWSKDGFQRSPEKGSEAGGLSPLTSKSTAIDQEKTEHGDQSSCSNSPEKVMLGSRTATPPTYELSWRRERHSSTDGGGSPKRFSSEVFHDRSDPQTESSTIRVGNRSPPSRLPLHASTDLEHNSEPEADSHMVAGALRMPKGIHQPAAEDRESEDDTGHICLSDNPLNVGMDDSPTRPAEPSSEGRMQGTVSSNPLRGERVSDSTRSEECQSKSIRQTNVKHSEGNLRMPGDIPNISQTDGKDTKQTSVKSGSTFPTKEPSPSKERKPYGPTHPLAKLRQSSGKPLFYSSM